MKATVKIIISLILFAWMAINIILIFGEPADKPVLFPGFTNLLGMLSAYIEAEVFTLLESRGLIAMED